MDKTKEPDGLSRRNWIQAIASAPALAAVSAASAAAQPVPAPAYRPKVFDPQQWRTVEVLSDLILPADERSGSATQAGVPAFIDDWLDFRKQEDGNDNLEAEIFGGLAWLDLESNRKFGKDFAAAAPVEQKELLDRIAWPDRAAEEDRRWAGFFNHFRDLTVSGFYSSKMGIGDLPYLGNTAVEEWKGCDPRVWKILERRLGE
jgi:Gluconate 2-dehydrogenase subunit 3